MLTQTRNTLRRYGGIAAVIPKMYMAYSIWVWMGLFVQVVAMIIMVAFWRAVFNNTDSVGGLDLETTINYLVLAMVFQAAHHTSVIYDIGELMRDGRIGIVLLRPVDMQITYYLSSVVELGFRTLLNLPLALFAWLVYGLSLPSDPVIWLAFLVSLLLGHAIMFCFDWLIGCVGFYSTEIWGLSVLRYGFAMFFSGALIPLDMMPDWLRSIAIALPFAQALYLPVSILSGITPVGDMPRIWLLQLGYLTLMLLASRLVFARSVRVVTVQGG
jgi:ABC-2 type transport system permease protein